jgi:hypothetical protein
LSFCLSDKKKKAKTCYFFGFYHQINLRFSFDIKWLNLFSIKKYVILFIFYLYFIFFIQKELDTFSLMGWCLSLLRFLSHRLKEWLSQNKGGPTYVNLHTCDPYLKSVMVRVSCVDTVTFAHMREGPTFVVFVSSA